MKGALAIKPEMSEEEMERTIEEFLPFIKYSAYRLAWRMPPQLSVDDLVSVGIMGLLDALKRYKDGIVKLSTFVEFRIKGAMLDELRSQEAIPKSMKRKINLIKNMFIRLEKKLGRHPEDEETAEALGITLDEYYRILQASNTAAALHFEDLSEKVQGDKRLDVMECISDPDAKTPLAIYEENNIKEVLECLIDGLPAKEKLILSLYYWEEMTMKEIGKALNLTEGRVSQLHNKILLRLKAKIRL